METWVRVGRGCEEEMGERREEGKEEGQKVLSQIDELRGRWEKTQPWRW